LQGAEPWLLQPHHELAGKTLQQYYKEAPKAEGVTFECKRLMNELVEEALVFNGTRASASTLTLYFEDFARDYDGLMRRIFEYLDSRGQVDELLKLASQYDLARHGAGDERHVSAADAKAPLREMLYADPLLREILMGLRVLLGYSNQSAPKRALLCESLRKLCATTHVGFFPWCPNGRVLFGRLPSMPECGETAPARPWEGNRTSTKVQPSPGSVGTLHHDRHDATLAAAHDPANAAPLPASRT